jgi:hypothetical protein
LPSPTASLLSPSASPPQQRTALLITTLSPHRCFRRYFQNIAFLKRSLYVSVTISSPEPLRIPSPSSRKRLAIKTHTLQRKLSDISRSTKAKIPALRRPGQSTDDMTSARGPSSSPSTDTGESDTTVSLTGDGDVTATDVNQSAAEDPPLPAFLKHNRRGRYSYSTDTYMHAKD